MNTETQISPAQENKSLNYKFEDLFYSDFKTRVDSYDDKYEAKQDFISISNLGGRTFDRYYAQKSVPSASSILNSYSFILNLKKGDDVFNSLPPHAQEEYLKRIKISNTKAVSLNQLGLSSPIHKKLYLRTMSNNTVIREDFIQEFGIDESPQAIDDLCKSGAIKQDSLGNITRGKNRGSFTTEELISHSKHLSNSEINAEKINSDIMGYLCAFHSLNLSKDGVKKAMKTMTKCIDELYKIENENKGESQLAISMLSTILQEKGSK